MRSLGTARYTLLLVVALMATDVNTEDLKRQHLQLPFGESPEEVESRLEIEFYSSPVEVEPGLIRYTESMWTIDDSIPVSITCTFFEDRLMKVAYSLGFNNSSELMDMFEREFDSKWYAKKEKASDASMATWVIEDERYIVCTQSAAWIRSFKEQWRYALARLATNKKELALGGEPDHRNICWGMTPDEVREKEADEPFEEEKSDEGQYELRYMFDDAELKAVLSYLFIKNRCVGAEYTWLTQPYDSVATDRIWKEVRDLYVGKYGTPTKDICPSNDTPGSVLWSLSEEYIQQRKKFTFITTIHSSIDFRFLIENLPERKRWRY